MKRLNTVNRSALAALMAVSLFPAAAPGAGANESGFTNVALQRPYTVTAHVPDSDLAPYDVRTAGDTDTPGRELTNGRIAASKVGDAYFANAEWNGFSRQVARDIVVDLGSAKYIDSVVGGFLRERHAAVDLPRYAKLFLSDNGTDWYAAGERTKDHSTSQTVERVELGFDGVDATARYVKLEAEVGMFTFMDEIVVNGREPAEGDRPASALPPAPAIVDRPPPTLEDSGGVHHLYLSYYYPGRPELGDWSKEEFKSVVAHTDAAGDRTGWMFDSVLSIPIGGSYFDFDKKPAWDAYLDSLFSANLHFDALDQATGEAKAELGDPDRRTKVVVSIPYLAPDQSAASGSWGEVNGEPLNVLLDEVTPEQSFDARKKIIDWYTGEVERRFAEQGFEHLELAGFYWYHEEIGFATVYEEAIVRHTADRVHALGKKLFWIPFYQANGSTYWEELGFDAVMMQPNYMFKSHFAPNQYSATVDLSRLKNTAATAKRFGLGVEVEGDYHMSWPGWGTDYDGQLYNDEYARRKYYAYLNEYAKAGLNETVTGYYLGAKTVLQGFYNSTDPKVRDIYDETAAFAAGTYTPRTIEETVVPLPAGDSWSNMVQLEAKEGDVYSSYVAIAASQWLKFPMAAGEDWVVTVTPLEGKVGFETRLWGETQTKHSGFSYGKSDSVQSLVISNPTGAATQGVLRVFPETPSAKYKITLSRPVEDGTTQMNALRLPNQQPTAGAASAGQVVWYKLTGKPSYTLTLVPDGTAADFDLALYRDANSGAPEKVSANGAGAYETIQYTNVYADSFVYYLKVTAKTNGTYTIYNGVQPPGEQPELPGDGWETAMTLTAKEGVIYSGQIAGNGQHWFKFPIRAGEDWIVRLRPLGAANTVGGLETRYFHEAPAAVHPHGGFSYNNEWSVLPEHRLLVSQREPNDSFIVVRVTGMTTGGAYELSLERPVEDGASKLSALPLGNAYAALGEATAAGQDIWYKMSGLSQYAVEALPLGGADVDVAMYWNGAYTNVLASSAKPGDAAESFAYANPYDPKFVYFLKVTAKTPGRFVLGTKPGLPVYDVEAPSKPASFAAADVTKTGVTLAWEAASDNVGTVAYDLYRDDALIATVTGTSYADAGLERFTTYRYKLIARDAAGNASEAAVVEAFAFPGEGNANGLKKNEERKGE
ncbi:DUF4855 domain-containing protein [Paenibacillus antri]|uniref:DUF4855 domain-containing protein n=1 Tax=Paenibacillus antri TaxID=2582848 RepID=A0A5R9GE29_9BACL|nr:DUF4855 domain-containing protein [Paenibacillus antri]TLS51598.1 DUF4855 domain-containing protein [Paenibacillus antri]